MYPFASGSNPLVRGGAGARRLAPVASVLGQPGAVLGPDPGRAQADRIEQPFGAGVVHEGADLLGGEPAAPRRVDVAVDLVADQGAAEDDRDLATAHVLVDPGEDHGPHQQSRRLPDGTADGLVEGFVALEVSAGRLPVIGRWR